MRHLHLSLIFLSALGVSNTHAFSCKESIAKLKASIKAKTPEPIQTVLGGIARPKYPDVTWANTILKFWYYTPKVSFRDRKIVAEMFFKAKKSKAKSMAELNLTDAERALVEKYQLTEPFDRFLENAPKVISLYSAGHVADIVARTVAGIMVRVPGVPSSQKLRASWIYNRALLARARGKDFALAPWESRFLASHKLTDHFNEFQKRAEKSPWLSAAPRAMQTATQLLVTPAIFAAMSMMQDELDTSEEVCTKEELEDAKNIKSLFNTDKMNDTVEIVVFKDATQKHAVGIKLRKAIYMFQNGYVNVIPLKDLKKEAVYSTAKEIQRVQFHMDPKEVLALKEDLQDFAFSQGPITNQKSEIIPNGVFALDLVSKHLGSPIYLNGGLGAKEELIIESAKSIKLYEKTQDKKLIDSIYVTKDL